MRDRPNPVAARPDRPDVLSEVLRGVHLTSTAYFDFALSSPWATAAPPAREIAAHVLPGAQRVAEYHVVVEGSAWAGVVGEPPVRVDEGDVILFAHGDPHVVASSPGLRAEPDLTYFRREGRSLPMVHELGGGGAERARIVCCFLGCDERPYNPLLAALPRVIHVSAARHRSGRLRTLIGMALDEAGSARPGSENVLARISELLFVETLRHHLETAPEPVGWLAGLRDPVVARALGALHGSPREPWTVEALARHAGASRSVLAERFTALVGQPPMLYLALWRMQLAAGMLRGGDRVAEVADAVGYESGAAFSRAYKKLVGRSPGSWRTGAASPQPRAPRLRR